MSDETKQRPRIITVASGKGGVGKTSFCVNLAIALSQFGKRVLIADADFGLSNVDVMLGVMTKYNIAHFLRGQRTMDEIVQIGYDGVRFISGGTGADDLLGITPEQLDEVIAGFSGIEMPLDYIICDAGAGIGEAVIKLAQASDEIFAVLTPEPTSATDAYALIKYVQRRAPDRQISIVMNRVTNMRDSEGIAGGFTDMIYRTQGRRVDTLGFIREDTGVPASIRNQTPHMVGAPASKFSLDVKVIARILLGLPPLREQTGFFRRIFTRASYAILGEESADVQDSGYGRFRTERVVSDFVENQLAASRSASADPFPARAERSANDPPDARVVEEAARIFSEISPPTAKPEVRRDEVRPEPPSARPAPEPAAKPAIKPL
ncbi:MAG: P-loop NTPase, partial [Oscillospiraceae bacterium]|nr:P-loop NTPase [Oscillospiraceae bacterium]